MNSKGYPDNWPAVALATKEAAGWRCVRCGHPHEKPGGERIPCDDKCDPTRHAGGKLNDGKQRMLTVHHADGNKNNLAWFNLLPLCQRCHLQIQGKVKMERRYMFEHSAWFRPYVAGWYAWRYLGVMMSREQVESNLEALLALERVI